MFTRQTPYCLIRNEILEAIDNYVIFGVEPGDFVQAILKNDLMEAVCRCSNNLQDMKFIVMYLHNEIPSEAHGGKKEYTEWIHEDNARLRRSIRREHPLYGGSAFDEQNKRYNEGG